MKHFLIFAVLFLISACACRPIMEDYSEADRRALGALDIPAPVTLRIYHENGNVERVRIYGMED